MRKALQIEGTDLEVVIRLNKKDDLVIRVNKTGIGRQVGLSKNTVGDIVKRNRAGKLE